MPRWTDCVKIHSSCGGIVRWVEAIHTPGVGWTGECEHCCESHIPVEHLIPVEDISHDRVANIPVADRRDLSWDESASWEANQSRLTNTVTLLAPDETPDRN